jgi:hypothetical protein
MSSPNINVSSAHVARPSGAAVTDGVPRSALHAESVSRKLEAEDLVHAVWDTTLGCARSIPDALSRASLLSSQELSTALRGLYRLSKREQTGPVPALTNGREYLFAVLSRPSQPIEVRHVSE